MEEKFESSSNDQFYSKKDNKFQKNHRIPYLSSKTVLDNNENLNENNLSVLNPPIEATTPFVNTLVEKYSEDEKSRKPNEKFLENENNVIIKYHHHHVKPKITQNARVKNKIIAEKDKKEKITDDMIIETKLDNSSFNDEKNNLNRDYDKNEELENDPNVIVTPKFKSYKNVLNKPAQLDQNDISTSKVISETLPAYPDPNLLANLKTNSLFFNNQNSSDGVNNKDIELVADGAGFIVEELNPNLSIESSQRQEINKFNEKESDSLIKEESQIFKKKKFLIKSPGVEWADETDISKENNKKEFLENNSKNETFKFYKNNIYEPKDNKKPSKIITNNLNNSKLKSNSRPLINLESQIINSILLPAINKQISNLQSTNSYNNILLRRRFKRKANENKVYRIFSFNNSVKNKNKNLQDLESSQNEKKPLKTSNYNYNNINLYTSKPDKVFETDNGYKLAKDSDEYPEKKNSEKNLDDRNNLISNKEDESPLLNLFNSLTGLGQTYSPKPIINEESNEDEDDENDINEKVTTVKPKYGILGSGNFEIIRGGFFKNSLTTPKTNQAHQAQSTSDKNKEKKIFNNNLVTNNKKNLRNFTPFSLDEIPLLGFQGFDNFAKASKNHITIRKSQKIL